MVYPGGPSRGCYTCRARKVKQCDEMKPVCQRCMKGNRTCGGYRVLDSNPSKKTRKRPSSHQLQPTKGASIPPIAPSFGQVTLNSSHNRFGFSDFSFSVPKQNLVEKQLAHCAGSPSSVHGQFDPCAFYAHILRLPQAQSLYGGCLAALPSVLSELDGLSPLLPALSALILTFVAERREYGAPAVADAIGCYGSALQLTRQVVEERNESRTCELILTIFILAMYDDLANEDHSKSTSNPHLEAAIAFVRTQKNKDFQNETNVKLYGALLSRALCTCFDTENTSNSNEFFSIFTIDELYGLQAALSKPSPASPNSFIHLYTCKLLILNLQLRQIEFAWPFLEAPLLTISSFLETISSLDHQLAKWPHSLPPEWKHMTIQLPENSVDIWAASAHIYPTFWAGNGWAQYRTLRVVLQCLRLRCYDLLTQFAYDDRSGSGGNSTGHASASASPSSFSPASDAASSTSTSTSCSGSTVSSSPSLHDLASDIATTHSKIRALTADICASMPYHLGYRAASGEIRYPSEGFPHGKYARLISACHIVWPLYVAGIVEGVTVTQRLWVSRQLDFIGREMGVGKAVVLAGLVRGAALGDVTLAMEYTDMW
ncbi:hypothetical protein AOCH_000788 [Aspergillus ochraceoroseus]|uniref:Zn(2)-C6 fungal-type domain-containing protein n=1 Tax=Aspergillus ochraceoroseus TaxID=138278 RepID=A0A0F8X3K6_9EURO|nr:hypothetical protein AOCH_000788 [Aspergillus ochraceoroseus]